MPRPILIDTDPGQDDAVGVLLALASRDELDVLAITAVAGNVPLALTRVNALKVVELARRTDIPVFAGCDAPLARPLVTAEHVHGRTGLDGSNLPDPVTALQAEHAVDAIIRLSRAAAPASLTICAFGPLTNIAAALVKAPEIAAHWREIVLMGGAYFEVGNITPAAEFNIYVDPEAAAKVLACGAPVTLLPLDVTHQLLTTRARMQAFRTLGNRAGHVIADMLSFSEAFDLKKYGWGGAPTHDPTVIAWLLAPHLFKGRHVNVTIETGSELTRGMSVVDYWRVTSRPANALYLREVDADGFFALLMERLARLP